MISKGDSGFIDWRHSFETSEGALVRSGRESLLDDPKRRADLARDVQTVRGVRQQQEAEMVRLQQSFQRLSAKVQFEQGLWRVRQTAHGFSQKDALGHNGSAWVLAQANASNVDALAIIFSIVDANFLDLLVAGPVEWPGHGFAIGQNYLSPSVAGGLTTTRPGPAPNVRIQPVLFVVDVDHFVVNPQIGVE